ncbi:YdeI/OmpD-associated family protein [Cytobacillus sp. Hz8]|uniref:YdeI/OmpD-associated family protein n=1 Tax=Cytobacillus sp. Hz8 TaxID=3347168 RepID=UPI0035DD4545
MTKTIVEKLNLQKYSKRAVVNVPKGTNYFQGLEGYDTELSDASYDLIFAFVLDMDAFKELLQMIIDKNYLSQNGYLYVAYPKKGNKVYPTYIHRDDLLSGLGANQEGYIGTSPIKFARMVGLDDVFTVVGLKEDSKAKNKPAMKVSQHVDDYITFIPTIEKDLQNHPELLAFYRALTPGYQKDWARYVYSAKQETTKGKRREEMIKILGAGYKTRDAYLRVQR